MSIISDFIALRDSKNRRALTETQLGREPLQREALRLGNRHQAAALAQMQQLFPNQMTQSNLQTNEMQAEAEFSEKVRDFMGPLFEAAGRKDAEELRGDSDAREAFDYIDAQMDGVMTARERQAAFAEFKSLAARGADGVMAYQQAVQLSAGGGQEGPGAQVPGAIDGGVLQALRDQEGERLLAEKSAAEAQRSQAESALADAIGEMASDPAGGIFAQRLLESAGVDVRETGSLSDIDDETLAGLMVSFGTKPVRDRGPARGRGYTSGLGPVADTGPGLLGPVDSLTKFGLTDAATGAASLLGLGAPAAERGVFAGHQRNVGEALGGFASSNVLADSPGLSMLARLTDIPPVARHDPSRTLRALVGSSRDTDTSPAEISEAVHLYLRGQKSPLYELAKSMNPGLTDLEVDRLLESGGVEALFNGIGGGQ